MKRQLQVKGCCCDDVGTTTGVPQIAADLRRRQSRQPWATGGHADPVKGESAVTPTPDVAG